jgi:hypothetical protein
LLSERAGELRVRRSAKVALSVGAVCFDLDLSNEGGKERSGVADVVGIGADGKVRILNNLGTTDVIVDLSG